LGIHLEGPWLNPIKRGAHLQEFLHSPTLDEVKQLVAESGDVIKMITLAPECCSTEVIQYLRENKILVSAGHTNATYQEAMSGFDSGITLATHLYNAMSPLQHREPGMVGAVLHHPTVMSSIIPDGYHVDWVALQLAQQLMGSRLFVITDAVTDTNSGPYQHRLAGDKYEADGVLSGSALTMLKACNNLMRFAGIEMDEALRLCSAYPAKAIGMENEIGKLEVGYKANFISLKLIGDELVMA
jgi:N-acetylglucosamine-6-phosphate deacetylase